MYVKNRLYIFKSRILDIKNASPQTGIIMTYQVIGY